MAKIGIDALPLKPQMTGVGNYLYPLIKELIVLRPQDRFYLYTSHLNPIIQEFTDLPNVVLRCKPLMKISEALWSQTSLAWMSYKDDLDIFWGTTQSLPFFTRTKQKNLITIYDFSYLLYPKTTSMIRGKYLQFFSKGFYKKADARIPISKGTAQRLNQLFSLKTDAIVTPPLKNQGRNEAHPSFKLKNYFLLLGTLEPRKNLIPTLEAYTELLMQGLTLPRLIIVGKKGWKDRYLQKTLKKVIADYPYQINQLGYLSDESTFSLIKNAKALIMPSLYEGYGMPIAEARSMGTPVICCDVPEMREAAENDAYFINLGNFKNDLKQALQIELPLPKSVNYLSSRELASILSKEIETLILEKK